MAQQVTVTNNTVAVTVSRTTVIPAVTSILAGTNIGLSPTNGIGNVTVSVIGTVPLSAHAVIADDANRVAGGNVTGTVASASLSNYATIANSVAGANVSGAVAFATTANSVAGANVGGTVASAVTAATVTNPSQPAITSLGTLVDLTSAGNITAPYFVGNVTGSVGYAEYANVANTANSIIGANVVGEVIYASIANLVAGGNVFGTVLTANTAFHVAAGNISGNVNFANYAGNITQNAQPNITSVGTLSSLSVTGVTTLSQPANLRIYGGLTGQVLTTNGAGNLTWVTGIGTAGNIANGTSSIDIPLTNGDIAFTVAGGPMQMELTATGLDVFGTITATSNITAPFFVGTATHALNADNATNASGAGFALVAYAIDGANVNGMVANAYYANLSNYAAYAGNVTIAAQPNITSVGTLTDVKVSGVSNLNAVGNVIITGGTIGQLLQTNGTGNLSWVSPGLDNGTSNVAIPAVNGNVNTSVGGVANVLVVTAAGANITGTLAVSGTTNLNAVGNVTITGGTTGQYLQTNGSGSLSWNSISTDSIANGTSTVYIPAIAGNVNTSVDGVANVLVVTSTGANILGTATATGNVTGGNLVTTGTGNIGTLAVTGTTNLNAVGNVTITGGTAGQYLQTDGSGTLIWDTVALSKIANGTSNVNIPIVNGGIVTSANGQANILAISSNGTHAQSTFVDDVTITGNLTVSGNTYFTEVTNVSISDPIIDLGTGPNHTVLITEDSMDRGLQLHSYGNGFSAVSNAPTPKDSNDIYFASTVGMAIGMEIGDPLDVTHLTHPTYITAVNGSNVTISTLALKIIPSGTAFSIGADANRFMGWDYSNAEFAFGSNITNNNDVISFNTLGNVRGLNWLGNVNGSTAVLTGNVTGGNLVTTGTGNIGTLAVTGTTNLNAVGNVTITGGTVGQYLQTNGSGTLIWDTVSLSKIANGTSNVNIPDAAGNVNTSVGGVANVLVVTATGANIAGTANVTGNVTAANLISNIANIKQLYVPYASTSAYDANVLALNGNTIYKSMGAITAGTAFAIGNTGATWSVAKQWTASSKVWYCDPLNGLDTNDGSINAPFLTIARAQAVISNNSGQLMLLSGIYSETVTWANTNINITGPGYGASVNLTGSWTFSHTISSVRVYGVTFNILNHTGAGNLYLNSCTTAIISKSSNAYFESTNCDHNGTSISITGSGYASFINCKLPSTTVANAGATLSLQSSSMNGGTLTVTAGTIVAYNSYLFSTAAAINVLVASAGTVVFMNSCGVYNNAGAVGRVSIAGFWSMVSTTYDRTNSTFTGAISLGAIAYTDNLYATATATAVGNITGGNLTTAGKVSAATANITGTTNLNAVGNVTITGGTTGQYLQTNGSGVLSWQTVSTSGAIISNGSSNVNIPVSAGNVNTSVGGVANVLVITSSGANITGTLALTGRSNLNAVGNVTITGGTTGQYLQTNGSGTLSWNTVALSTIANGTSNVSIPAASGNVNISVGSVANIVAVNSGGATLTGNLTVTGTTSLNAVGNVFITGGVAGQYLQTNGTGNLSWQSISVAVSNIANGSSNVNIPISGGNVNTTVGGTANVFVVSIAGANITGTGNVTGNMNAGNLVTAGQVNGGTLAISGTSNLNAVGNVTITGGTAGQALTTNGSGVLSWSTVASGGLANGTSNVSIPAVDGNVNTSVGGVANVLVITGTGANIAGTANVTGNITGANLTTAGKLTAATANITGTTNLNAVGNVTITGGTVGQVLTTDGTGVLTWTTAAGGLANGTSNVLIPTVNGNVNTTVGGVANVLVITSTGANITGTLNSTGKATFPGASTTFGLALTSTVEKTTINATALTATTNFDLTTQTAMLLTTNALNNWILNFRASSGTTLNTALAVGESISAVISVQNGAAAYYNTAVQVDGTTAGVTMRWQGSTGAPGAGNINSLDIYTYAIMKTAASTYTIVASLTQFA